MTNVIVSIAAFTFMAYLLGHQHGRAQEKKEALAALGACNRVHAEEVRDWFHRHRKLALDFEALGRAYVKAIKLLKRQRRREWKTGRN